jgi:hypothetical protein
MKYLIIVLAILSLNLTAQSISSSEGRIQGILKQKIEYNKFNEGEYDGFRVKIHSSGDLGEAQFVWIFSPIFQFMKDMFNPTSQYLWVISEQSWKPMHS